MNPNQVVEATKSKLTAATTHFTDELKKLRTGRAHPSMLDNVMVEVYGQLTPLKAAASVVAPEAQLLQITPFDPANLQAITDAIRSDQALGLNPADDGRVVRINLPPLTSEDRQRLAKVIGQKVEECMIAARQIRQEARQQIDQSEKTKDIGRDEATRLEKQIDDLLTAQKAEVDQAAKVREQEILTV